MRRELRHNSKGEKLYPFSNEKHAHDIEFRYNRICNEIHDMQLAPEFGGRKHTAEEFDKAWDEMEKLQEVYDIVCIGGGISWLTGKQYAIAKECVAWASETRANTQRKKRKG